MADNVIAEAIVRVGVEGLSAAEREFRGSASRMEAAAMRTFQKNRTPFESWADGVKVAVAQFSKGQFGVETLGREIERLDAVLKKASTPAGPSSRDKSTATSIRRGIETPEEERSRKEGEAFRAHSQKLITHEEYVRRVTQIDAEYTAKVNAEANKRAEIARKEAEAAMKAAEKQRAAIEAKNKKAADTAESKIRKQVGVIEERHISEADQYKRKVKELDMLVAKYGLSAAAAQKEQKAFVDSMSKAGRFSVMDAELKRASISTEEYRKKKFQLIAALEREAAAERNVSASRRTNPNPKTGDVRNDFRGRGILELSRGLEDFAVSAQLGGWQAGLRGAGNNVSQFLAMISPMAGALGGIAVAAAVVGPSLYKMYDAWANGQTKAEDFTDQIRKMIDELSRLADFREFQFDINVAGADELEKTIEKLRQSQEVSKEQIAGLRNVASLAVRRAAVGGELSREELMTIGKKQMEQEGFKFDIGLGAKLKTAIGGAVGVSGDATIIGPDGEKKVVKILDLAEEAVQQGVAAINKSDLTKFDQIPGMSREMVDKLKGRQEVNSSITALETAEAKMADDARKLAAAQGVLPKAKEEADKELFNKLTKTRFDKAQDGVETFIDVLKGLDPLAGEIEAINERFRKLMDEPFNTPEQNAALAVARDAEIEKAKEQKKQEKKRGGISGQFSPQDFARRLQDSLLKREDKKEEKAIEKNTKDAANTLKEQLDQTKKLRDDLKNQVAKFS